MSSPRDSSKLYVTRCAHTLRIQKFPLYKVLVPLAHTVFVVTCVSMSFVPPSVSSMYCGSTVSCFYVLYHNPCQTMLHHGRWVCHEGSTVKRRTKSTNKKRKSLQCVKYSDSITAWCRSHTWWDSAVWSNEKPQTYSRHQWRHERCPNTHHIKDTKCWKQLGFRKCVIPVACVKLGKLYVVKHNSVTWGVFNDYIMDNYMFWPVLAIFRLS